MFLCSRCETEFESYDALRRHVGRIHKVNSSNFYVEYYLNGICPLCECGCGSPVKWRPEMPTHFMRYVNGHNSYVDNPMTGKTQSTESRAKMSKVAKEKFATGERVLWSTGLSIKTDVRLQSAAKKNSENKERADKISKALTGVPKSEIHKERSRIAITKAWENPELRSRQRDHAMDRITSKGWFITSKLEDTFATLLDSLQLHYHRQHYVRTISALYDFHLSDGTLVEVHGDYWHCKPGTKFEIPQYDAQHKNLLNDAKKRQWCIDNNIPLLVFWESDINDRPDWVMLELKDHLHM